MTRVITRQQREAAFAKGNPGRPKGARHRVTLAAEALFDGEAEALSRKAIELALAGDITALRLCLDRIVPPRRERPVVFSLPLLQSATDAAAALGAITVAAGAGEITLGEAAELAKLVEAFIRALEANEFEERLRFIEARQNEGRAPPPQRNETTFEGRLKKAEAFVFGSDRVATMLRLFNALTEAELDRLIAEHEAQGLLTDADLKLPHAEHEDFERVA